MNPKKTSQIDPENPPPVTYHPLDKSPETQSMLNPEVSSEQTQNSEIPIDSNNVLPEEPKIEDTPPPEEPPSENALRLLAEKKLLEEEEQFLMNHLQAVIEKNNLLEKELVKEIEKTLNEREKSTIFLEDFQRALVKVCSELEDKFKMEEKKT